MAKAKRIDLLTKKERALVDSPLFQLMQRFIDAEQAAASPAVRDNATTTKEAA